MKKLHATLLLVATVGSATAQTLVHESQRELPRRDSRDHEIGLRYGAQIGVGAGSELTMQYIGLEYARYNFYNIGLRTGINYFVEATGAGEYLCVPMQFTWRSGKLVHKKPKHDPRGYYYNGQFYPDDDYGKIGPVLSDLFLSRVPSVVELHAGLTPGLLPGTRKQQSADSYSVDHRFVCTADVGARLMLPIRRVRIYVDVTYHYYLTRNFYNYTRNQAPHRSFVGISGGAAVDF